jgi:hypothetical protein
MHWLVWLVLLACAGLVPARTAVVASANGSILRGQVRLTGQGIVVVNADQELWQTLALTNLAWAYFDAPVVAGVGPVSDGVPEPWLETDVGSVMVRGSTRHRGEAFTLGSAGLGLRGTADSLHYVYQRVQGDCEIVAYIAGVHQTRATALAGVMARESLDPEARQITVGVTPAGRGVILERERDGAVAQLQAGPVWRTPCWIKLRREGAVFVAYQSRNGCQWMQVGCVTLRMNEAFNLGLVGTSGAERMVNWTTFDQVRVGQNLGNELYPPRAELVSGSVVMGQPSSLPGGRMEFRTGLSGMIVPTRAIARLIFQWASPEWLARLPHEQSGVWLANGEFLEGDFRAVDFGRLRVSSVLYGSRSLDANDEVLMVAMQRAVPRLAPFEITTVNGSVFRALALALGDNEVLIEEPALGQVIIPIQELASITRR